MHASEGRIIARDRRVCEPNKLNAKYVGSTENKATFLSPAFHKNKVSRKINRPLYAQADRKQTENSLSFFWTNLFFLVGIQRRCGATATIYAHTLYIVRCGIVPREREKKVRSRKICIYLLFIHEVEFSRSATLCDGERLYEYICAGRLPSKDGLCVAVDILKLFSMASTSLLANCGERHILGQIRIFR